MAVSRSSCALAVLAIVLVAGAADARKPRHSSDDDEYYHHKHGHGHGHGGSARGYLVQGNSIYEENRPKDPTPLAPTSASPYAIAHRGSSGELPEETREDYEQAIALGADFIEGDTVLTKDGHLILRHEPNLSNTTNADDLFKDRTKTYVIDFLKSTGVHAIDLTLAEIKTLKARQRVFSRDQSYNDMFGILTLEEYLDILLNAKRVVGGYIETKHPTWHDSFKLPALKGKSMTQLYIEVIKSKGYGGKLDSKRWLRQPIFLQSFEQNNLKELRPLTDLPIVQLLDDIGTGIPDQGTGVLTPTGGSTPSKLYGALVVNTGLDEIAKYADAIGPWKETIAPGSGTNLPINFTTNLIDRAHARGLQVHPYTFRNEPINYATNLNPPTIMSEYELFFRELGADGVFSDFVEGVKFYLRFSRANADFPKRQIFPKVNTATNASATA